MAVHLIGKKLDGTVFDNTYEEGQPRNTFLHSLIPGLQLTLPKMKEGAKWEVFVPSDMAYRRNGRFPDIGPNEMLIYEVELISVSTLAE
jgi:FKBP-type peptidyl-prolyl cis-trans isomerase FklB